MLGLVIILGFLVIVAIGPFVAPFPAIYADIAHRFLPPSSVHLFGTDDLGRDVFSRILYGAGITLQIGVIVIAIAYSIGLTLGSISGYYGGLVDDVIMGFTNLILGFPSILLAMAITSALGPGLYNMMLALSFSWWPWCCRVVRSQVMSLRRAMFVEAAKAVGATDRRIILFHVLPNSLGPILVQATVDFGWTVLVAASLGYLGLGAQSPSPEWGLMMSIGRMYFLTQPWLTIFPGLAIFAVVLGTNLLGDGLRDVLDPRLARR
jgi:peptide/nickel transport system permease protein